MKKKITTVTVFVCIALFIPLVIGVIYGLNVDPNSVTAQNLKKLSVSYGDYNFTFEDEATMDLYTSISQNATEIDASFRNFDEETPYEVTFTESNGTPITYKLYMSTNSDDCVYVSPDGKYYMMNTAVAQKLIVREEFSSLNEFKSLPVATLSAFGKQITLQPDTYSWTYTALDNSKPSLSGKGKYDNPLMKFDNSVNGFLRMNFDKAPDSLVLKITDGNDEIFNGKYEQLANSSIIAYNSDTSLTLTATAQWYEIEGAEYYGEATYTVPLLYDIAPSYRVVDANGLPAGDFTVLRISDFNDGEKLTVVNDIGLPEQMNVYDYDKENNVKIAFVPLKSDLAVGSYNLVLKTESGHEQIVEVKVRSAKERGSETLIFTDDALEESFTKEGFDEFEGLVQSLTQNSVNEHLYEGKFVSPNGERSLRLASGGAAYGTKLNVISRYTREYIQSGIQLSVMDKQDIVASNNGVVVYAGKTVLYGNTVIVDHGCGVLSYYGNLDSIDVKVGDSVTTGETVLGKAGSTGFACVSGGAEAVRKTVTYFAVSFGGVFIDPSSPCSYGINI